MDQHQIVLVDRKSHLPSTVTARELLEIGYRRRRTFGWCFAAIFLGAIVAAAVMPKRYESELKILVHRERADPLVTAQQTAAMEQNMPSLTEEDINSEVALLRSQDLLENVVVACGLQNRDTSSLLDDVLQWVLPARAPDDEQTRIRKAALKLGRDLRTDPVKKSFIISVSYPAKDPQFAAQVLNTLGNLYLAKHAAVHRPSNASDLFDREAEQYRKNLEKAEGALAEFNRESGLVTSQSEKDTSVPKLAEFELDIRQTEAAIPAAQEHVRSLESLLAKTPPRITTQLRTADNGALMQQLRSSLVNLEQQRVDLTNKYAAGDRMVREVDTQIAQVKAAIEAQQTTPLKDETTDTNPTYEFLRQELAKAQSDTAALRAKAASATAVDHSYRQTLVDRDQKQLQQEALMREVKVSEANYLLYLNKKEEAHISDAFDKYRILNVSIAQPATVPFLPTNPVPLTLVIGWLVACLFSMAVVFVQDRLDPQVHSPQQIEKFLDVPVLAQLQSNETPMRDSYSFHYSGKS
jgi:uncharacterized protein involved in exopolysaccharide biosynthesis